MAAISKLGKTFIGIHTPLPYEMWNPKSVDIMIRMDEIYECLIRKLNLKGSNDEDKFFNGVQLFIFSGAMFEAWANFRLWEMITDNGRNGKERVLKLIERNSIYDKLDFMASENIGFGYVYSKSKVSDCIDLRNRLMHFKDKPFDVKDQYLKLTPNTLVGKGEDPIMAMINQLPNAPIYDKIVDMDLERIKEEICSVYSKWNELFDLNSRTRH